MSKNLEMGKLYRFVRSLLIAYLKIFRGFKVNGLENIPKDGGVILAANHLSNLDPFVLAVAKKPIAFFAKKELFSFPPLGKVLRHLGTFAVDREGDATSSIKMSIKVLEEGYSLGIYPEGTRNKSKDLTLPFRGGVSLIAAKSKAPVVPVAITGSYGFWDKVTISFGKPLQLLPSPGATKVSREDTDAFLTELENRVKEMLIRDRQIS